MAKKQNLVGRKFGRLTVQEFVGITPYKHRIWKCVCECGNISFPTTGNLTCGRTNSCGCLAIEIVSKPYSTNTPTYNSWKNMRQRVNNIKTKRYKDWGGRGITICKEWEDYEQFLNDMGERPKNTSLDRIDNNKGYSKENCRWATPRQQGINRRTTKINKKLAQKIKKEPGKLKDLADKYGVSETTIHDIRSGKRWA